MKKKEGETQKTLKFDGFLSFTPLNAKGFSEFHPVYDQTQGSGAVLSGLY
jgi:hypothetical protein